MMKIKFLGTGTSTGVPYIGCKCEVCHSADARDVRLRTSAMVEIEDKQILIDCGPDFRMQVLRCGVSKIDGVLLTHEHIDHMMGLDDLRPFGEVQIYADKKTDEAVHRVFSYCFGNDYPGIPKFVMNRIEKDCPFYIGDVVVEPIEVMHGKLSILGFKIGRMAYLTDVKSIPEGEMKKLMNLDFLVINALRIAEHHSHLSLSESLEIIDVLKPKQAYLTHIAHSMGLHAKVSQMLPPSVSLAYDGLEVSF